MGMGDGSGGNAVHGKRWGVMGAMGSNGEQQVKLHSLACHSPPAVQPGSQQATDWYQPTVRGLGTPAVQYY